MSGDTFAIAAVEAKSRPALPSLSTRWVRTAFARRMRAISTSGLPWLAIAPILTASASKPSRDPAWPPAGAARRNSAVNWASRAPWPGLAPSDARVAACNRCSVGASTLSVCPRLSITLPCTIATVASDSGFAGWALASVVASTTQTASGSIRMAIGIFGMDISPGNRFLRSGADLPFPRARGGYAPHPQPVRGRKFVGGTQVNSSVMRTPSLIRALSTAVGSAFPPVSIRA